MICVDYADILAITLPYNRHHFLDVMIVTAERDKATQEVAARNSARVYITNAFWSKGEAFNKWAALEEAMDHYGRVGWICNMDADVLWPKYIPEWTPVFGNLYTPKRRIMENLQQQIPQEPYWKSFPLPQANEEFAGYTQIFNCDDPRLGKAPWHEVDWKHAGGADTHFQLRWPDENKIRPPFEVLHLGPPGVNWCGRATKRVDGTVPEDSAAKQRQLRWFLSGRRGRRGRDRYKREKL